MTFTEYNDVNIDILEYVKERIFLQLNRFVFNTILDKLEFNNLINALINSDFIVLKESKEEKLKQTIFDLAYQYSDFKIDNNIEDDNEIVLPEGFNGISFEDDSYKYTLDNTYIFSQYKNYILVSLLMDVGENIGRGTIEIIIYDNESYKFDYIPIRLGSKKIADKIGEYYFINQNFDDHELFITEYIDSVAEMLEENDLSVYEEISELKLNSKRIYEILIELSKSSNIWEPKVVDKES